MDQVIALIRTGELAMDFYRAQEEATKARDAYHARINEYENTFNGGNRIRLDDNNPAYGLVREFTKVTFEAHESAKKKVYRAKRKLLQACEKMRDGSS
jgi:hypothetical protein